MKCLYCDKKAVAKKMCMHHYDRARLRGDPLAEDLRDGRKSHSMYRIWVGIKDRCCNPNSKYWGRYGGRGITICERWTTPKDGFWNFVNDMGDRPPRGTVDRIDNDKGYSPENCRWASLLQQAQNRRRVSESGTVGVYHINRKRPKQWCASIVVDKKYHSKYYATKEEAIIGRKEMEEKYGATPEAK